MRFPLLAGLMLVLWGFPADLFSDPIDIEIDRSAELFQLGISDLTPKGKGVSEKSLSTLKKHIVKDLAVTGLFKIYDSGPVVKNKKNLDKWAQRGAREVLAGEVRAKSGGKIEVSVKIFDVGAGKEVFKTKKRGSGIAARTLAHQVANEVVWYYTGQKGIFESEIVYINDYTGRKELYIAEFDGFRPRRLTNDNSIVILPRISPDRKKIIFTSYRSGNPDLYIINVDGKNRKKISGQLGLNVSPSWSPNNKELAVTLSKDGPPNIYLIDLNGKVKRRLTDGRGADTAPAFSPDGSQIAFTSDRAGQPHIYVTHIDGSGLRRLTTEGHCDSAAWSPDGATLVYVKGKAGKKFDIYSIEVLTGVERRLTWGEGDNENPNWSPDSRLIIFTSSRRGKSELFTMLADGSQQKPLVNYKGKSFTPHW